MRLHFRNISKRSFSSFYDSQSGKYIRNVLPKNFDLSLINGNYNQDIINNINKSHTVVIPSISNIKKIIDNNFNTISAISHNVSDITDIITYNNTNNTNIEATFLINEKQVENLKELKDMFSHANINNIITTSIIKLDCNLDLNRVNNFNANLADWECKYILLYFEVEDEDLIRDIIENAFNIDCENEPMNKRLGVFTRNLQTLEILKSMNVMHFGIDNSNKLESH